MRPRAVGTLHDAPAERHVRFHEPTHGCPLHSRFPAQAASTTAAIEAATKPPHLSIPPR